MRGLWLRLGAALVTGASPTVAVEPTIGLGSHMVLQRDTPLAISGIAKPGEQVRITFAADRAEAIADAAGQWRVLLPPQEASREPRSLVIQGDTAAVTLVDVLVGEVWLCAGQSNMLLPLARAADIRDEPTGEAMELVRLFSWRAGAGGDRGGYGPAQLAALEPGRFGSGRWERCTAETAADFSAVAYFFAARLAAELDLPVGVLGVAVGGTPAEAWAPRAVLAGGEATRPLVTGDWLANPLLAGWCADRARENLARGRRAGHRIPGDDLGPNHPFKPGFMWEAGLEPLVPLANRGICWYQGESNADSPARVAQHEDVFPALVTGWRAAWKRPELPIGIVQLPGMGRPDWPAFRDSQRRLVEATPHAGLVVTIDLGDPREVHPADKRPIGERLATWALVDVYGKPGPATGPRPRTAARIADGGVRVTFTSTGGGLATRDGEPPVLVEVAGVDGTFQPASAHIEGDAVVVRPAGAAPAGGIRKIRHAWRPFPEPRPNLTGKTGLPATPFQLEVE